MGDEKFLTAKEVREILSLPRSTFYDLRKRGDIPMPCYPFGDRLPRYKKSEIMAIVEVSA